MNVCKLMGCLVLGVMLAGSLGAAETLKRAVILTSAGSFVEEGVKDPSYCQVKAERFAGDDDAALTRALATHPKIYVIHATDENIAKWEGRVDRIRLADPSAQIVLVADAKDGAGLRQLCRRRDILFVNACLNVQGSADRARLVASFLHRFAPTGQGIDYNLLEEKVLKPLAAKTQRLHDSKWGVFNHYLGYGCKTAEEWNRKVNSYDVKLVADQLESCGARFYFITLTQCQRWMCAPNAAFDRIGGMRPGEATSFRDLPMELSDELGKRGIDLYLYFEGEGPIGDPVLGPKFGYTMAMVPFGVSKNFVKNWAAVLEDYAVRYGERVKGWWIDSCYAVHHGYTDELLSIYAAAVKKGNPKAVVSFNDGVKDYYAKHYANEDFTCGEFDDFYCVPKSRFIDGAQAFALIPLGTGTERRPQGWGRKGCRRSAEYVANYVDMVNANGGVIAIDVAVEDNGAWEPAQLEVLKAVGRKTGTLK